MVERDLARGADVLDVFSGSGVQAHCAARDGATSVTAVDLCWSIECVTQQRCICAETDAC